MVLVSLKNRLEEDLTAAIKGQKEPDRTVLRSLAAAIKNAEIETGGELDEAALTKLLSKQLKQREESAEAYATRPELAEGEQAEAKVIAAYLPEAMGDDELAKLVDEAVAETGASSMADMGKVMGALNPKVAGRADGGKVAGLVKAKLGE